MVKGRRKGEEKREGGKGRLVEGGEKRGSTLGYKNDLLSITGLKKASYLSLSAYLSMIAAFPQIDCVLQSFSRF